MSIKSELQEILEPYRNGGDYEDFEMLTQAILDLLDKSLPKEKDTPIQETINENYGKCEVPVGYAVMREKQAIADYKKRLIEKLEDESLVLDWVIKLVEETE